MSPTIAALYEVHRHQILLDALRHPDQQVLPSAYLYALDRRISPIFHTEWTDHVDPFEEAYRPNTEQAQYIYQFIRNVFSLPPEQHQSFNQLVKNLGGQRYSYHLRVILRYCFQSNKFDQPFYDRILTKGEYPEEVLSIIRPYTAKDIQLV
ncbi:hypothetical protein ACFPK9_15010 [Rubritalea spongiae]|uniref:Uncharacterized protein n=1 Tax=Rubritalea spongiae TaxID=430797 RepID=A0ABW5DY15_9BACT